MQRLKPSFIGFVALAVTATAQIRQLDPAVIEKVALEELRSSKTPGAAVAVVMGDRVIFSRGYGVASVETGASVSPDMLFRLGSTTKMFTASAVVGLSLEGKIDPNAPISQYIPGLDDEIGKLTANQLLSHTAGLHDEAPMFGSHDETALGKGIHGWKADFLFAPPGQIYSYSNPGFWLAGYLAESVSGKPYADVINERLFGPLGMKTSTLRPTMAMTWPLAQGHDVEAGKPVVIRPAANNAASWPAGSIFSSSLDLSRFVIAFMNNGTLEGKRVLPPKLIAIMSTPHTSIPGSEAMYGYGLELSTRRGVRWVEHAGSRAGYGSLIRMAPERKFAVIITANRTGSSLPKLADAISEAMLPLEPEVHRDAPTHALTPGELKRYAGAYVNGASRIKLDIEGGALTGGPGERKMRFTQAGDGFLLEENRGEDARRLTLVPNSNGRIKFVFDGGRAFRRVD
jgi:CubicO group peptidase (beta-lactamase class C family)